MKMENFKSITEWRLLKGSHKFPGPEGGTCINEAAIIAAGFEYKEVHSANDCPPCFSRPIAAYAIKLNDSMPDELRQSLLMPFVTRLAGTADTREVEALRVKYMAIEGIKRILSLTCERRLKRPDLAAADAYADAAAAAYADAAAAAATAAAADAYAAAYAAADAAAAADAYAYAAADAAAAAAAAAYADAAADTAAYADAARKEIFTIACEILDGAILLGKHTELEVCEVAPRLEAAKREKISA